MKSLDEIKKVLKDNKEKIRSTYQIKEIGIFGSYVKEKMRETSDIDILIEFEKDARVTLIDLLKLENYLTELFGVRVDIVIKEALKPNIGKRILEEVIYL
ncbi:MAG: nucleotidyltransferase family protein [Candidatus Altiarchaeota archaeon]